MSDPSTVMPIERAEPAIVRTAASRSAAVRSGILVLAISSTCARGELADLVDVRLATLVDLGGLLDQHRGRRVLRMKVKDLSANAVITTGSRAWLQALVCALNALQNSMMFRPR